MIDSATLIKISTFDMPLEITVSGTSMKPALLEGDVISIKKQKRYYPGDILAFYCSKDQITVHRLLKVQGGMSYCKGDNSFLLEHVCINNVLGKIVAVNRYGLKISMPVFDDYNGLSLLVIWQWST